jgi:hypothetical protein
VQEILRQDGVWRIPTRLASQARQWTLKIIPARALQSAQYLLDTAYCLRLEIRSTREPCLTTSLRILRANRSGMPDLFVGLQQSSSPNRLTQRQILWPGGVVSGQLMLHGLPAKH